jgi:hypothetical protein
MHYKIKALAEAGVKITLHYFDYKSGRNADDLKLDCEAVFAYRRKSLLYTLHFSKPHIVASRINQQLIERLNTDNNPILLEGVHCTGIIPLLKGGKRKIIARLHNDEAVYYKHLAKVECNFFNKLYYIRESLLLKRFQNNIAQDITYIAISKHDAHLFTNRFGFRNVRYVPAFTPWQEVTSLAGNGNYCLYHGNLSVAENEAAALWLIETVFSVLTISLIIAGKNISNKVKSAAAPYQHIHLKTNPDDSEMTQLIREAQVHVLPNFNNTGIKLKVLHALFCGRFCITGSSEIQSSDTVACAHTAQDYIGFLKNFMSREFTEVDRAQRKEQLLIYNNQQNARLLITHLY